VVAANSASACSIQSRMSISRNCAPATVRRSVQPAHVELAACDEGPHPQFLGQDEGLPQVALRALEVGMIAPEGDFGEGAESIGAVPALAMCIGQSHRAFDRRQCVVHPTGEQIALAELGHPARLPPHHVKGRSPRDRLLHDEQSLGHAPSDGVGMAKRADREGREHRELVVPAQGYGSLQRWNAQRRLTFEAIEVTERTVR